MKLPSSVLLSALLITTGPAMAQATEAGNEAETDIEIVNGVPVDRALHDRIMNAEDPPSIQELIDLSNAAIKKQADKLVEERLADDSWMKENPFGHLKTEMQELAMNIDESNTGRDTQQRGEDVVRKLDTLIAAMEQASKACSACSGGGGSGTQPGPANGNSPAQDSTLTSGPGGSGELLPAGEGNNRFGDLTDAQQQESQRALQNQLGFSSEYDELLAEYYARLAADDTLSDSEDEPAGD